MSKITGQAHSGHFTVNGRKLSGTLKEAGEKSELHLFDPVFWHMQDADMACIYGSLHDLTKVSLFANNGGNPGSQHKSGGTMYFAHAFPHYIISGDYHLHPADKVIKRISFHLNDAEMLFYDMDAFGQVIKGEKFIDDLVNEKALTRQRTIPTGLHPEIFYFTGVFEILKIVTPIGTVTANHSFTNKWPGPWGISVKNAIVTGLEFDETVDFDTAIRRLMDLQRYLEILIGRPQNISDINLAVPIQGEEHPAQLSVDWSMLARYDYLDKDRQPQPTDMLIQPVQSKDEFSKVTAAYFNRSGGWKDARWQFSTNYNKHRSYDIARMISVANMFDILPSDTFGPEPTLTEDMLEAKKIAKAAFKKLPKSPERESVLNALGRLGQWVLKRKIASRLDKFLPQVSDKFPDLVLVTEKAVNCRNFFVHGGKKDFDYATHDDMVIFFVDTLEFVFAASELAEAGWDVKAWANKGTSLGHRFAGYMHEYENDLAQLKKVLAEANQSDSDDRPDTPDQPAPTSTLLGTSSSQAMSNSPSPPQKGEGNPMAQLTTNETFDFASRTVRDKPSHFFDFLRAARNAAFAFLNLVARYK